MLDSDAIESFGNAADTPADAPTRPAPKVVAVDAAEANWPDGLSKTFLVRYPDSSIPAAIEELQSLINRNKHQTVLLALRRGIEVLQREADELGERADLIR